MDLAIVGLGRMGGNMARRLPRAGHRVVAFNRSPEKTREIMAEGLEGAFTPEEAVAMLPAPHIVWLMVPAGDATEATLEEFAAVLSPGDWIVDGGNANFRDSKRRHAMLRERGLRFVDAGISGGVWGLQNGYGTMVGGDREDVEPLEPIFRSLAPEGGYVHCGPAGSGHYVKMVHNGIEYGLMQAYAEGWELMAATDLITDVPAVVASWQQGTVIRSWLLDLMVRALDEDPDLAQLRGYAQDSGEGRWTVQAAVDHAVPLPVITAALYARFASRQDDSPAMKVVAALRNQFGGHAVTSSAGSTDKGADSPGADAQAPAGTEQDASRGAALGAPGTAPGESTPGR